MKHFRTLTMLIFAMTAVLTSCTKDPEDRLPGDWDMIWTFNHTSICDMESETYVEQGSVRFEKDGTGIMMLDGEIEPITWSATEDKVTILNDGEVMNFDVIENEKEYQKWEWSYSDLYPDYTFDENKVGCILPNPNPNPNPKPNPYPCASDYKVVVELNKK